MALETSVNVAGCYEETEKDRCYLCFQKKKKKTPTKNRKA